MLEKKERRETKNMIDEEINKGALLQVTRANAKMFPCVYVL